MLNTKKIEIIRKQNNYNQEDFAQLLNISTNTYQNLIKSGNFRAQTIEFICKKFGVNASYLFDESEKIDKASEPDPQYGLRKENQLLKSRISDLEKIIELLEGKKNC